MDIVNEGDKVHYQPEHYQDNEFENGIVKHVRMKGVDCEAWVVYNCNDDWENFKDYTGALTNLSDLRLGWKHD